MKQKGAALLMALLTVALVATFAAASLWQQWRAIEVETAERARIQSAWIITGALDWARLLLREDQGRSSAQADHLGEPWAVPLQEARLSTFLAADRNNTATDAGAEVMDAFLSGQIIDLQSLMNINNMVDEQKGALREAHVEAFARLFDLLGLPRSELDKLSENLRYATWAVRVSPTPMQAPLRPKRVSELAWLGVSAQTIAALEPYVTLLPTANETRVNVNTAAPEVIAAAGGIELSEAQRLVQVREASHFKSLNEIQAQLNRGAAGSPQGQANELSFFSNFFEVRSRLRLDQLVVEERAVLWRQGVPANVTVVTRERGTVDPTTLSKIAITQQR